MQLTLPVREVLQATPRARIVRLDLSGQRFPYEPGQAVTVGLPGARRFPYSLAAAPHDAANDGCLELLIGTEGNTREFQEALGPGTVLDVHGPVGQFTFEPRSDERRFAFIAAGTGIAPLRAMLRQAVQDPHTDLTMVYSARTPAELAYHDELQALARAGRIGLHLSVTRHQSVRGWNEGRGRIGRDHVQQIVRRGAPVCFICGPTAFVAQTRRLLIDAGLPQDRVRVEHWLLPRPSQAAAAPAMLAGAVPSLA
jgi:3-ketosteroid 9alpha-monooxygenase subunit B